MKRKHYPLTSDTFNHLTCNLSYSRPANLGAIMALYDNKSSANICSERETGDLSKGPKRINQSRSTDSLHWTKRSFGSGVSYTLLLRLLWNLWVIASYPVVILTRERVKAELFQVCLLSLFTHIGESCKIIHSWQSVELLTRILESLVVGSHPVNPTNCWLISCESSESLTRILWILLAVDSCSVTPLSYWQLPVNSVQ